MIIIIFQYKHMQFILPLLLPENAQNVPDVGFFLMLIAKHTNIDLGWNGMLSGTPLGANMFSNPNINSSPKHSPEFFFERIHYYL